MLNNVKSKSTNSHVIIGFEIPTDKKSEALGFMQSIGATCVEDAIHFNDCKPAEEADPATMLRALRRRESLTQVEVSKRTGISQRDISKMENGKLSIGKERARVLASVLHTNYKVFL